MKRTALIVILAGAIALVGYFSSSDPFERLHGGFEGEVKGREFRMQLEQRGEGKIFASMYFSDDPETKVYLQGEITGKTVDFVYKRQKGHFLGPDEAIVVLTPTDDKTVFDGYWFSDAKEREEWTMTRISEEDSESK